MEALRQTRSERNKWTPQRDKNGMEYQQHPNEQERTTNCHEYNNNGTTTREGTHTNILECTTVLSSTSVPSVLLTQQTIPYDLALYTERQHIKLHNTWTFTITVILEHTTRIDLKNTTYKCSSHVCQACSHVTTGRLATLLRLLWAVGLKTVDCASHSNTSINVFGFEHFNSR